MANPDVWVEAPNDGCSSRLDCLGSSVDGMRPLTHFTSMPPMSVWLIAQNLVSRRLRTAPMDAGRRTQTNLSNKPPPACGCILARCVAWGV